MLADLILIGPSGSGKGTQAQILHTRYGYHVVGMGQILRDRAGRDDELGQTINRLINHGDLVPETILTKLLSEHLAAISSTTPLIFDGFPREVYQAELLSEWSESQQRPPAVPIYLELDTDEAVRRLLLRRVCKQCGTIAHATETHTPIRCPACHELLARREDDQPKVIAHRLETFQSQTLPVIQYYDRQRRLKRIDARGSVSEVTARIEAAANLG